MKKAPILGFIIVLSLLMAATIVGSQQPATAAEPDLSASSNATDNITVPPPPPPPPPPPLPPPPPPEPAIPSYIWIIMAIIVLIIGLPVTAIILVVRFLRRRKRGAALAAMVEPHSSAAAGRCSICGQDNPPEARFCGNCGATLGAGVRPPSPVAAPGRLAGLPKWLLIGGLAILIIFGISYGVASLFRGPSPRPTPVPPPRPAPAPPPRPAPTPPSPKVTAPPITKGEVLFFEDFESGSRNWDLWAEGWHLEKIGDNTVLKGTGHNWAVLEDKAWDNYAFEARFKPVKGNIHFNYRCTSAGNNRYFVGVPRGDIYLKKESGDELYQIAQVPLKLDEGWHEIEIIGYGNAINVYVDDTLVIRFKDDNPLLSGGIAFQTLEDSEFLIDDVRITETSESAATTPTLVGPEAVTFSDKNLEAAIRDALGKPPGEEITTAELAKLTELDASGRGISDLSALEYCTNLTKLILDDNEIDDVSPLASLTKLTRLVLYDNEISDISPLASLSNLTELNLNRNEISDISTLASLTNLTKLHLNRNEISDISTLSSLTNLTELTLEENEISDLSPLASLTKLTELSLEGNEISDITPLVENSGLGTGDEVWLEDNNLDLREGSEDMENIETLEDRGVRVGY